MQLWIVYGHRDLMIRGDAVVRQNITLEVLFNEPRSDDFPARAAAMGAMPTLHITSVRLFDPTPVKEGE